MQCGSCGYKTMKHKTFSETLVVDGKSFTVHDLKGFVCPKCADAQFDRESYVRLTQIQSSLLAQQRKTESQELRSRIKVTQRELAQLIGVGALAISRYERGATKAPPAYLTLLRLLAQKPELIEFIRHQSAA